RFGNAQAEFTGARETLRRSWLLAPMHVIPPLQRQVDALALVADIGAHGAHAATMGTRAAGTRDLAELAAVESDLKAMTEDRSRLPRSGLAPQISEAVSQVDTHLRQA